MGNNCPSFENSPSSKAGRPIELDLREIINAILYLIHTGCQWRELPHDFPLWNSVYYHCSKYKKHQTWELIHREIHRQLRHESGKDPELGCPNSALYVNFFHHDLGLAVYS